MVPVNPGLLLKITGTGIIITKKMAEICRDGDRDSGWSLYMYILILRIIIIIDVTCLVLIILSTLLLQTL